MSFNQSMSDMNETQYRKTWRSKSSNQQHRGFSPAYPTGVGAGGPVPSISSNRSFKKSNNNAQRGQSRANITNINPSDAGASETSTTVAITAPKQTEPLVPQRTSQAVPKAPASQSAFVTKEQAKQWKLKVILNKRITPENIGSGDDSRTVSGSKDKPLPELRASETSTTVAITAPKQTEPSVPQRSSQAIPKASASQSAFVTKEQAKQWKLKAILNKPITPENIGSGGDSLTVSGSKDKPLPEQSRTTSTTSKGKKKRKEILSKAAAARVKSDLCGAYKNPEDKKDIASSESVESTSPSIMSKQEAADSTQQIAIVRDEGAPSKAEPDDWEGAADISTPKLGTSDSGVQACGDKDGSGHGAKKYSRDFLLEFSMQYHPEALEIMSDIAETVKANVNASPSVDFKPLPELSRTKSTTAKGKKKRKEILSKSAATMVKSDLYGAYKNPEDKKDIASSESVESTSTSIMSKQEAADSTQQVAIVRDEDTPSKAEPDDWEDATDISTPKLGTSRSGEQACGDKDGSGHEAKKYSRDFLLKFSMQSLFLPEGFETMSGIAEFLNANLKVSPSIDYKPLPELSRTKSTTSKGKKKRKEILCKSAAAMVKSDQSSASVNRSSKKSNNKAQGSGQSGANVTNVNPSDAGASGTTVTFTPPKQTEPSVPQRSSRGVPKAPASQSAFGAEEQAKQRQLKAILNKRITPQNLRKMIEQVKAVNIDNAITLTGVVSQIYDKALTEPTFCEMYANFCFHLAAELPDFSEDNEKITFKRLLLNKCQEEFERGEREQEEANKADEEGEVKQSEEEREEKRIKARRQMLGNIRLIGELYKKKMLTERVMHECIKKLLGQQQTPDEEDIEALCKLMCTIGEMIDHPKAKEHMDAYFERMKSLSNNMKLSSRVRFILKDTIDLRKNKWQQRRKVEEPKMGFTPQMGPQLPQLGNLGISIAAQYPQQQGDASKGFSFQFGSISSGLMNGMQIPARTSSAPPNLDEQKRDQARHESFRPVPSLPTPSVPKHQLPRKDQPSVDHSSAAEAHLQPKTKKDVQVSPTPPASQTQKPSGPPMTGISMPMPFHQPQVSVQFGGPNQQIQSQGMTANLLQMPMPIQLPIGSTQVQHPVFVPGLQAHPMQPPGIMHQAQKLGFTPQMGPQLGNLGINIAAQYPQQQGGKFAGPRKTPIKITHPDTHEELRLDKWADSYPDGGSSAARTHPSGSQSQPMPSFATSHPTRYYTNSYNPNPLFFPSPNSYPLTSSHMPRNSQAPRFSYPVSQGPPQSIPFMNPSAHNSLPVTKSGPQLHGMDNNEVASSKLSRSDQPSTPSQSTEFSGTTSKQEGESVDDTGGGGGNIESIGSGGDLLTVSGSNDKPLPELSRTKSTIAKGKKKRKEILSKADAAGVTSDLYGAYKNPEDKKDIASSESAESTSTSIMSKQEAADSTQQVAIVRDEGAPSKAEPDDWKDVADRFTPKLGTSDSGEQACGDKDGSGHGAKKYSRDFLLKFSMQFLDLPEGFEITSDIAEILNANVNASPSIDHDSLPSLGRIIDRPGGAARLDRHGIGMIDDDRWSKGGNANFRPGQGGVNYGVLRSPGPRGQVQHVRGILLAPIAGSQGGMQRNNPDADRWQRATNFQPKVLIPSPQTPLQVMHRAERKYEIGKVSDEEQAKQRQLKAILNKLTPQNFEKLFKQVKAVNIDNATTLTGVVSQIYDKALTEPTFCEMYANFCFHLAAELPDFSEDNEKITFKRLLLNKCEEEFERGEREQEEANKADEEGEVKQSEEEREEKRIKARRRMLGNLRLIGELYKKKMLTERIMHERIKKLLGQQQTPNEEDIEALCKLMSTIGEMIDHPKVKEHMDAYFERVKSFSNNMKLSSRVRFMLKDTIDLRKYRWQQRRKVEEPKKIDEVHRDAAQERQAHSSILDQESMDFSPRGSTMLSVLSPQMSDGMGNNEVASSKPSRSDQLSAPSQCTEFSGTTSNHEGKSVGNTGGGGGNIENIGSGGDSLIVSGSRNKRAKSTTSKRKKKRKEIISKAAAAMVKSDPYGAYKNPEDKKDIASSESVESTSTSIMSKQEAADSTQQVAIVRDEGAPSKAKPDDWEDAADITTPKLGTSDNGEQACGDKDGSGHGAKKYSREFLLKFSMQLLDLPEGFEIMSDIAKFLNVNVNASPSVDYKPLPELSRTKSTASKGKKKIKEIFSKSAAAMVKSDQSSASELNVNFGSRDPRSTDRTPPPARALGTALTQNVPSEKSKKKTS